MTKVWSKIINIYRSLRGRLVFRILSFRSEKLQEPEEVCLNVPGIRTLIHLRLKTSDVATFKDIFVKGQYHFQLPESPEVIIDAGANIGLTSLVFANQFPEARIIAVEPELSNYEILKKNTAPYVNIVTIQKAVWNKNEVVSIVDPGLGNWGFQVGDENDDNARKVLQCPGITIDRIMQDHGVDYIDILKMDIEGGEKEVFADASQWIDKVGLLIVELHDRLKPGCSTSLNNATGNFNNRWEQGENVYFSSY